MSIASQGIHGSGARAYTPAQYAAVVAALTSLDVATVAELAARTGVSGRAVREIISAADGVDFVVTSRGRDGYRIATSRAEAATHTAKIESQAARMTTRAQRRRAYAAGLPE